MTTHSHHPQVTKSQTLKTFQSGNMFTGPKICLNLRFLNLYSKKLTSDARYTLGKATWSIKKDNNLGNVNLSELVSVNTINYLSKLSCIDLSAISRDDSLSIIHEIQNDVNIILKCAQSLQVS